MNRRTFLQMSLSSGAAVWLSGCTGSARQTSQPKKLLILGGTNFLGPAIVELALLHGHELTLFNRGITRPYLFPGVEKLRGNRALPSSDLKALEGERKFDAVIDVWPQQSGLVRETAELLADRTDYYFFVSSIAAYRDFSRPGLKEDAPTHVDDPGWYGSEKAESERIVQKIYGERSGIARCHAIVGYRDPGTSFHYWIRRFAEFDEVLAPGSGKDPVQFSDVRDVAAWILGCAEAKRSGIHNICGPAEPLTLRALLEGTRDTVSKSTRLVWADSDFLRRERGLQSFTNFPLWAPPRRRRRLLSDRHNEVGRSGRNLPPTRGNSPRSVDLVPVLLLRRNDFPDRWSRYVPRDRTRCARCLGRREQVTVNSALWTAFLAAQYRVQGDSEAFRSRAGMAVSTRDGLSVPVGDALGFYASSLTAELKHDPRASFWDGARKIHGARTIESVYGPFVYSDVNEKVVGVTTVGGRMTFSLVCNGEAVGADVAMSIRDSAMARLKEAVE